MTKQSIKGASLFLAILLTLSSCLGMLPVQGESRSVAADPLGAASVSLPSDDEIERAQQVLYAPASHSQKTLRVHVGGVPFGVKFMTDGVLVVGLCEIKTDHGTKNPAKEAGLRAGDVIKAVNGKRLGSAAELTSLAEQSGGKSLTLLCVRDGKEITVSLTPARSVEEGRYKTGLYVRDSGAGIGTVTFIMPKTCAFAGLGHGICDAGTGALIPMERGAVVDVTVSGVVKGLPGAPGEIKGFFKSGKTGTLLGNTECGVYGVFANLPEGVSRQTVPIGGRNELKEGKAYLVCTLEGGTRRQYEIEISSIRRDSTTNKCFHVKVTDPALLSQTGGIVQGMGVCYNRDNTVKLE